MVAPNSGFTEATHQLVSGDEAKTMARLSASFSKLQRRLLLTSSFNYCKTREEHGKEACRKYFAFCKQDEYCYCKFVSYKLHSCFLPKTPLQYDPVDDYYDTITDGLSPRQPSGLFFAAFNAAVFLLLLSPLVTFNAHTP